MRGRRILDAVILFAVLALGGGLAMAAARMAADTGSNLSAPVCVRVGTRSEGWAWPSGRFIRWAKCKDLIPSCVVNGKQGTGWYSRGSLIALAACNSAPSRSPD